MCQGTGQVAAVTECLVCASRRPPCPSWLAPASWDQTSKASVDVIGLSAVSTAFNSKFNCRLDQPACCLASAPLRHASRKHGRHLVKVDTKTTARHQAAPALRLLPQQGSKAINKYWLTRRCLPQQPRNEQFCRKDGPAGHDAVGRDGWRTHSSAGKMCDGRLRPGRRTQMQGAETGGRPSRCWPSRYAIRILGAIIQTVAAAHGACFVGRPCPSAAASVSTVQWAGPPGQHTKGGLHAEACLLARFPLNYPAITPRSG